MCPYPSGINDSLFFQWNVWSVFFFTFSAVTGILRVRAYRELGTDFTFAMTKPSEGLRTTGLYRYVRHPSYTTGFLFTGNVCFHMTRIDGILACFIPGQSAGALKLVVSGLLVILADAAWLTIGPRINDEEAFLDQHFGKEWRDYVQRTWRLFPGIY